MYKRTSDLLSSSSILVEGIFSTIANRISQQNTDEPNPRDIASRTKKHSELHDLYTKHLNNWDVKSVISRNPHTHQDTLHKLSQDVEPLGKDSGFHEANVKANVATHPNTATHTLSHLFSNGSHNNVAENNRLLSSEKVMHKVANSLPLKKDEQTGKEVPHINGEKWPMKATELASKTKNRNLLHVLARHNDPEIKNQVAANVMSHPSTLLHVAHTSGTDHLIRDTLASNPRTPTEALHHLYDMPDTKDKTREKIKSHKHFNPSASN